jgi:hypothetical protein
METAPPTGCPLYYQGPLLLDTPLSPATWPRNAVDRGPVNDEELGVRARHTEDAPT